VNPTPEYVCVECGRRDFTPHQGRDCRHCGRWHCLGCLPDHEGGCARNPGLQPVRLTIGEWNTPEGRFQQIEAWFLGALRERGIVRSPHALYNRPKPGDAREPTEEELVRRIAEDRRIALDDVWHGINNAFLYARSKGNQVVSFRFCIGFIQARLDQTREAAAGRGPR
jgi:hypothetical protein